MCTFKGNHPHLLLQSLLISSAKGYIAVHEAPKILQNNVIEITHLSQLFIISWLGRQDSLIKSQEHESAIEKAFTSVVASTLMEVVVSYFGTLFLEFFLAGSVGYLGGTLLVCQFQLICDQAVVNTAVMSIER